MSVVFDPQADLYRVLGIESTANNEVIQKAHRSLIREVHPDRGGDPRRAAAVNGARDVLLDPVTRREYDQARAAWIAAQMSPPPAQEVPRKPGPGESTQRATHATRRGSSHKAAGPTAKARPARPAARRDFTAAPARLPDHATRLIREDVLKALQTGKWLKAAALVTLSRTIDWTIENTPEVPDRLAAVDALVASIERHELDQAADEVAAHASAVAAKLRAAWASWFGPDTPAPRAKRPAKTKRRVRS
jgi:DnaJ domain